MLLIFVVVFLVLALASFTIAFFHKHYIFSVVGVILVMVLAGGMMTDGIDIPTQDNVVVNTVNDSTSTATITTSYTNYNNIFVKSAALGLFFGAIMLLLWLGKAD